MKEVDNKSLIIEYLNGDIGAFEKIIRNNSSHLYNFIFRIINEKSATEDILQETFLKIWKNIKKFDQNKNFKTWIFTIAKNTSFDYLRKNNPLTFSDFEYFSDEGNNEFSFAESIEGNEISPITYSEQKGDERLVSKAMNDLKPIHKTVLTLRYHENFSIEEISEILNKPRNTVKSHIRRGIEELRNILKK